MWILFRKGILAKQYYTSYFPILYPKIFFKCARRFSKKNHILRFPLSLAADFLSVYLWVCLHRLSKSFLKYTWRFKKNVWVYLRRFSFSLFQVSIKCVPEDDLPCPVPELELELGGEEGGGDIILHMGEKPQSSIFF